ncbi:MAG TPA: tail fiber domain-containing protein, partial [Chitinophagales bacterium]|nr:tail fiber domain-containing protein [Chitinophagales bacterium]
ALAGAGLLGSTNNNPFSLLTNNTQRIRLMNNGNIQLGSSAVLNATPVNYAQFDDDGDLKFFGTGSYLVPSNTYAFRWEGDEDIGLFFSAAQSRYEFRDNLANAVFHISAAGDVHANGELNLDGNLMMGYDGSIGLGTLGAPAARLHIFEGEDASLAAGGVVILGAEAGVNLTLDINEIMARNNHAASTLFIQNEGGNTWFGGNSSPDLLIDETGKVGIRTSAPTRELELVHGVGSGNNFGLMLANEGANNQDWTLYTNNSDGDLGFYQNGTLAGEFSDFDGLYTPSDARLKTNVKDLASVLDKMMKLEPKTFNYNKSEHPDKTHIGFIAQEMEKQFPEIVGRAGEDQETYVMNYSMLSVLAIKAIQEQQQTITAQQEMLEEQKLEMSELKKEMEAVKELLNLSGTAAGSNEKIAVPEKENVLYQNQPNPFSDKTTINVKLSADVTSAFIRITNLQGTALRMIPVTGHGDVAVEVDALAAGSYFYTLIVNGSVIDAKKMVVLD